MVKILGVDFAPVNIPLSRRKQTLSVILFVTLFCILPFVCMYLPIYLLWNGYYTIFALYGIWFLYDIDISKHGSRPNDWLKNLGVFGWFRDYFPVDLQKTTDLDPNRNYIFGCHPHGVFSIGAFTNFATNATGFPKLFPNITPHIVTLVGQFWFPVRRELITLTGAIESSKESISNVAGGKKKGEAVVIIIGGAIEVLNAAPGTYQLQLAKRKGFIKIALKTGADLVPVFSFGENELYTPLLEGEEGTWYRRFEECLKYWCGYPVPLVKGRGIFNYNLGLLPIRHPIHTIVGRPISVGSPDPTPTQAKIDEFHTKYIAGLKEVFEENKLKYGVKEDAHITII